MNEGMRFSQLYLDKGNPVNDSRRMRNRISAMYYDLLSNDSYKIVQLIHIETGAKVPVGVESYNLTYFFENCEIRDLLDSITLISKYLLRTNQQNKAVQWMQFISRIFKEENVGYQLDNKGGVHFFIDEEFERNRSAIIAGLSSQPAVKDAVEKSYSFLDQDIPDTASSIRSIFEALEILYKHIVKAEGKDRLNSTGVLNKLKPLLQQELVQNQITSKANDHMLDSLCDWIEAGHMYRHGQKLQEPSPPPLNYAVLFISQGASYIRYLLPLTG